VGEFVPDPAGGRGSESQGAAGPETAPWHSGSASNQSGSTTEKTPAPPRRAATKPPPGTPVEAGASVAAGVPYRTGTKSRYLVSDGRLIHDLESQARDWSNTVWTVATEVMEGDGSGAARIKLTVESFRFQTQMGARRVDFDSAKPDKELLADEQLGPILKPLVAICGIEVEFRVDSEGRISGVEGIDPMRRKYLDAVDTFGARAAAEAEAPDVDRFVEKWAECLFPPVTGGTYAPGATRRATFRTTYFERWAAASTGVVRATHDDQSIFRLEFKAKPQIEELSREARGAIGRSIVKAQVVSSEDSYVASWRFDREKGRLVDSEIEAKYRLDWVVPMGTGKTGNEYERHWWNLERLMTVELLPP
jgi:hypothetical protein